MDNILDLNGKRIEEIEREAYNKFMAVKIDEDRYIFPANIVNTEAIDANFKKSDLFNDLALVKKVKSMDFSKSNSVIITCADKYEDGTNVVELVDTKEIDNDDLEDNIYRVEVKADMNTNDGRQDFIELLAYFNRDRDIVFQFFICYDLEQIKELLEDGRWENGRG
ncbi:hypothetical protein CM240_2892 [Clostridium bornimense]|uniref:Uncharacterized protein n=1 Tax=Clostridium bornimense TaxID=1216932 RepID=W6S291_9CLOT|nr:hypothetical protein [Clostridium bornimense]CDM70009.1 hypothetical protein CM240_2892 [Clostridium bornimense]